MKKETEYRLYIKLEFIDVMIQGSIKLMKEKKEQNRKNQ